MQHASCHYQEPPRYRLGCMTRIWNGTWSICHERWKGCPTLDGRAHKGTVALKDRSGGFVRGVSLGTGTSGQRHAADVWNKSRVL